MRRLIILGAAILMSLALTVPASAGPTPPGCWDFELTTFGDGDGHGDGQFTEWGDHGYGFAYATFTNGIREFSYDNFAWTGTMLDTRPGFERVHETFGVGPFSFEIVTKLAITDSLPGEIWSTDGTATIVSGGTGTAVHSGAFDIWGVRFTELDGTICF